MKTNFWMIASCMSAAFSTAASANVLQQSNVPLDLALSLAQGAIQSCASGGFNVAAAVVDSEGVLRALLRADNAGFHTPDAARRKALTAASMRRPTSEIVKTVVQNPEAQGITQIDDFLVLAGGIPIHLSNGTQVIGGLGVGGAPSGDLDEGCAFAALNQSSVSLRR